MKKTRMLKKNYEFKEILTKGKYYSGKQIEAIIKDNNKDKDINFLGLAISVKIAKAVRRNYIKRLIRENYKNIEDEIETGKSIIFLWKKKINPKEANYKVIEEDMNNIFEKANLKKIEEIQ